MYRMLVLYMPPKDPAAFRSYYTETHLPLAATLPGLRGSQHGFDLAAMRKESPYFCVWQGDFDSQDSMVAALASPEGKAVAADMANYATGGAVVLHHAVLEG